VKQYFATNETAAADISARDADIARAQSQVVSAQAELDKARVDLQRREALSASGAVSGEEVTSARTTLAASTSAVASARAALAAAQANRKAATARLEAQEVLTAGSTVETNPEAVFAKAAVDIAKLDVERTVIRAPVTGVIARRQVQLGQRVAVGAPLMTVVPTQDVYVDANFKEVQLRKVRVGQPATLTSDLYGDKVEFHGKVAGIGGGTGSAFAVIPAQNATGNWIKVVQRLPVRIALDPKEVAAHPLRVGLSMKAKIDITRQPAGG
jgi:membrane fusion protein (multidrug efflux system)